ADQPKLGRLFVSDDCMNTGPAPVVVLSEEVWRDRFGGDPAVVGTAIQLNDQIFTVAGVAPARSPAKLNRTAVVWAPYTTQLMFGAGDLLGKSETPWLTLVGRLRPGFSRRDAGTELGVIASQQDRLHPGRRTTMIVTDGSWFEEPGKEEIRHRILPLTVSAW